MSSKKDQRVRSAALSRDTNETKIVLAINLDGGAFPDNADSKLTKGENGHATQVSKSQVISINSGIGFLDHMLHALAKHAGWSFALICKGDLHSENLMPQRRRQVKYANCTHQLTTITPLKTSASPLDPPSKTH
jgi:imidazoleglycerol-phosphate dehydratase